MLQTFSISEFLGPNGFVLAHGRVYQHPRPPYVPPSSEDENENSIESSNQVEHQSFQLIYKTIRSFNIQWFKSSEYFYGRYTFKSSAYDVFVLYQNLHFNNLSVDAFLYFLSVDKRRIRSDYFCVDRKHIEVIQSFHHQKMISMEFQCLNISA